MLTIAAVVCWGAVIVAPTGASAAIVTQPAGLSFGDQYRLAFVTLSSRDATSTNIADYNNFVTTDANNQAELLALGTTWSVIGSTLTVDARDNTGTTGAGVPIYLLDGSQLAANNALFRDGTLDHKFNVYVDGTVVPGAPLVWTGTQIDGTALATFHLGTVLAAVVSYGTTDVTGEKWVFNNTFDKTRTFPNMYGLSGVLTAVPLPAALPLFLAGLAVFGLVARRRQRGPFQRPPIPA